MRSVVAQWWVGVVSLFWGSSMTTIAQGYSLKGIVDVLIATIGGYLIPLSIALLFIVFVYSILRFLWVMNAGSQDLSSHAKNFLLYPVIILFIVFSLWGILSLIRLILFF